MGSQRHRFGASFEESYFGGDRPRGGIFVPFRVKRLEGAVSSERGISAVKENVLIVGSEFLPNWR
jgi:hypothetical protein